jgi:hypothetical protein
MNRPQGSNGDHARGAGSAVLRGTLLIGFAIIIGLVLLQQVHDSNKTTATAATTKPKTTTTKPKSEAPSTTSTTVPTTPPVPPAELKLIVLNGGAASGKAGTMSTNLRTAGYTNQPQANNWTGHTQTGNSVLCKPGFNREAVALSQQSALQGSKVEPYPTPPPPTYGFDAQCVVVVGAS